MNGEDHRQVFYHDIVAIQSAEQNREQASLPIVAMEHVGGPCVLGKLNGGAAEFAVALGVVGVVAGRSTVEPVAIEVGGIVDKEIADSSEERAIRNGGKAQAIAERNRQTWDDRGVGSGTALSREYDGDFVPLRDEGFGESLDHIGETAGLREW